jgi:hypothetical protein
VKTNTIEIGDAKFAVTALDGSMFVVWRTPKGVASASMTKEQLETLGAAFCVLGKNA